jgi:hypothetical protein
MLSPAKTFFPEAFEALKGWPIWVRVVLFILVVSFPVVFSIYGVNEIRNFMNSPIVVMPISIATVVTAFLLIIWLTSIAGKSARHQRLVYQFCEAWLEYLPFMFLLVTKIQSHELSKDGQIFEFLDENKEDLKKFHEWRARLRELLFKVGESELNIEENQHWEKLKKESKVFEVQSYLTPFSFILDQTQPWLIAVVHQDEAWAALHISDEFIERVAFKHPKVERLWKRRQKRLEKVLEEMEQNA